MMTRIKLCGLSRLCDVDAVNDLRPEYVGFVFWEKSRRYVAPELAASLRKNLAAGIQAVGVFVDECPERIAALTGLGVIDVVQLHGSEDNAYISCLRTLTNTPIIQAFRVSSPQDLAEARESTADFVMLDSGRGTGSLFDWSIVHGFARPFFLAGGLTPENVAAAIHEINPFAVDVSSGIETQGVKDRAKMTAFVESVRAK